MRFTTFHRVKMCILLHFACVFSVALLDESGRAERFSHLANKQTYDAKNCDKRITRNL